LLETARIVPDPLFRLASASPRRSLIFGLVGIPCVVSPVRVEERTVAGDPASTCLANASHKALASRNAAGGEPPAWTLGADTVVVLGPDIMGKPAGPDEARSMLERLSGRTHEVFTGWSLVGPSGVAAEAHAVTRVTFRRLDPERIDDLVRDREWTDKAGGYAIQGRGAYLIRRIDGDAFNVMGLPVGDVVQAFLDHGVIPRFPL
jgi:septum formation protein